MQSIIKITTILLIIIFTSFSLNAEPGQKVGLVLGGGGAKGLAHIGVLKAFEEYNIPIDYISGTSSGALIGGFYAAGVSIEEMLLMVQNNEFYDVFLDNIHPDDIPIEYRYNKLPTQINIFLDKNSTVIPMSVISDGRINEFLAYATMPGNAKAGSDFDELVIPFRCITSDILSKKAQTLSKGSLWKGIRSSLAYPFIYAPIFTDSMIYVDGGLYDNLPIDAVKSMGADYVIAVNVSDIPPEKNELDGLDQIFSYLSNVFAPRTDSAYVDGWDYYIQVDTKVISLIDFRKANKAVQSGYKAGLAAARELRNILDNKRDMDLFRAKQHEYRTFLNKKSIQTIDIEGNHNYSTRYIRGLMESKTQQSFNIKAFRKDIIRLNSTNLFSNIFPEISVNDSSSGIHIKLKVKENQKNLIQGGFYYSNTGGINLFTKRINNNFLNTGFKLDNNIFFGNHHIGIEPTFTFLNHYKIPIVNLRYSASISASAHAYDYNSNILNIESLSKKVFDVNLTDYVALGWNKLMGLSLHLRTGYYSYDQGKSIFKISDLNYNSPYIFMKYHFTKSRIHRQLPIMEGFEYASYIELGKTLNINEVLPNFEELDKTYGILTFESSFGKRFLRSMGMYGKVRYSTAHGEIPLIAFPEIDNIEFLKFTLNDNLLFTQIVGMSLGAANRIFSDKLWLHLNYFRNESHYKDITNIRNSHFYSIDGLDVFICYDSILGPASYGITFVLKDEIKPVSWAKIGFQF